MRIEYIGKHACDDCNLVKRVKKIIPNHCKMPIYLCDDCELDMITDGVMAGLARSGEYRKEEIPNWLLKKAFDNTIELLLNNVEIKGEIKAMIKEILMEELGAKPSENVVKAISNFIGKKCMIRTYSAGVHFGEITSHNAKEVELKNAYRVHYWDGACSLSQLAVDGSKERGNCRISVPVNEIYLSEAIEIIPMTDIAYQNLTSGDLWKS